jgi:hypothetical protein
MIPIAVTAAAYFHATCSTPPEDAPLMAGPSSGRPIIEAAVLDHLKAMGRLSDATDDARGAEP